MFQKIKQKITLRHFLNREQLKKNADIDLQCFYVLYKNGTYKEFYGDNLVSEINKNYKKIQGVFNYYDKIILEEEIEVVNKIEKENK